MYAYYIVVGKDIDKMVHKAQYIIIIIIICFLRHTAAVRPA